MRLEEMLTEQYDFQREFAFNPDELSMNERERQLEKFVVHTNDQAMSVLDELNWKDHEPSEPVDFDQAVTEIVDTLKYVLNMAVALNVSPEEIEAEFRRRSREVRRRQEAWEEPSRCPDCETNNVSSWVYNPDESDGPIHVIECNECGETFEREL